jgi:uncharacterized membrane protein YcaP (DUF421 family)
LFTTDPLSLIEIVVRTLAVYVALLLGLRLAGKRELGQMTPFDLVVFLIVANAVQNAMVGADTSLNGGLLAAAVLIGVNYLVNRAGLRSKWFRQRLVGTSTILVNRGQYVQENLRREGVTEDDVLEAIREHGVNDVEGVRIAVLEVDGTISVVPTGSPVIRTKRRFGARAATGR